MIYEVTIEAYQEGKNAKGFAEKKSGIIFPQPVWMQYSAYKSLSNMWRSRKDELKFKIDTSMGEANKAASSGRIDIRIVNMIC